MKRGLWVEQQRRPRAGDAFVVAAPKGDLVAHELRHLGALPGILREQRVGLGERLNAPAEGGGEIVGVFGVSQGLVRDRLHRRERVLDPVAEFLKEKRLHFLRALLLGDVASHLRSTDDGAGGIAERRYRQRNIEPAAVLGDAYRLVMSDAFARLYFGENFSLFILQFGWNNAEDRLPDHFAFPKTENALCAGVPRLDNYGKIFGDNRVVRRRNNGGEPRRVHGAFFLGAEID